MCASQRTSGEGLSMTIFISEIQALSIDIGYFLVHAFGLIDKVDKVGLPIGRVY